MAADEDDIRIGKGVVSFKKTGESEFRDLGFVPSFAISADITEKDYNSAREGITTVAKTFVTKVKSVIKFRMDSVVPPNLGYFALADVGEEDTSGDVIINALTETQIGGILKVEGTNDVGRHVDWIGAVTLRPDGDLNLITDGDDFTGINMLATVQLDDTYGRGQYTIHPLV